ncbi:MAG: 3-hydroxyacyl-CoA dehydrogenase NAD-binding domain-containing protein, partial [Pseudomonadota bacterium]
PRALPPSEKPREIRKAAVIGMGAMGTGIAQAIIAAGIPVVARDENEPATRKGMERISSSIQKRVEQGKLSPQRADQTLGLITTTTSWEPIAAADLVIEAVFEDAQVKRSVISRLEDICGAGVLIATNTSTLSLDVLAEGMKHPERFLGLHFFNPAHRMQLLEIICAERTSDQTLATSVHFARTIGKIPIAVNDGPGFYVTRQLITLLGGSVYLVSDGVDANQIENAVKGFGMPMGPAELEDLTGIDIGYHVNKTFEQKLGSRYKIHPLTELIYRTGCYGRKTGSGYMDYTGERPVPNRKVVDVVEKYISDNGVLPRPISDQEIIDTLLGLAINEAALMIEEGICDRPREMDLAMIYGAGFPAYRGGVLRYADTWGASTVYDKLLELEARYGERFKPAALLKDMAASGKKFYQD